MAALEGLVERTHREINEARVKVGMQPVEFNDDAPPESKAVADPLARPCGCGCGLSMTGYRSSWKFIRGHKPGHLKATPRVKTNGNGRAHKVGSVLSDDMSPIVDVIDQQIKSLGERLLKLRQARESLAGL